MKRSIKHKLAEEILSNFPNHATLTLAKKLYQDNPLVYKDVEDARGKIRYLRGESGEEKRKKSIYFKENKKVEKIKVTTKLPESYGNNERKIFKLPIGDNNILMLSDLHIPYQDNLAIESAVKYGIENNINTVFINGDLLDFYNESRFEKDPRKRHTVQEFNACQQFLLYLREKLPKARIYWIKGNHDKRYENWLMVKAPQLFNDPYYHLEERLQLNNYGVILIDDVYLVKMGKLNVTHGHLLLKGVFAPVNAARGVFMKGKASTIIGHVHKVSEHQETDIDGNVFVTYSTGCLCELYPDYSPMANNFMHGFAHIRTENNGDYHVRNFKIINGKIY